MNQHSIFMEKLMYFYGEADVFLWRNWCIFMEKLMYFYGEADVFLYEMNVYERT